MFLVAASNFDDALHASHAEDTTLFKQLEEIVEKYVLEGAPFEINIDSQTKSRILRLASAASFHKLSMVRTYRLLIWNIHSYSVSHSRGTDLLQTLAWFSLPS